MHQADAYYRGFLAYLETLAERSDCQRDRRTLTETAGDGEIAVTRITCTVDEEWISAIEAGLVHIEKAIREDRQFIYSNGEVVPIERVKHVSKDSVEHLARHAELISRAPEGEDIVPDKLYTVERLSDYAVYENRFLYMLLCYLRDFVSLRYRRIRELTEKYEGTLTFERELEMTERSLSLSIRLQETRENDPYLRAHNTAGELLDRMDLILKTVAAFLATPLMESAGKAAMLRPPITKTNVLKMDNNFKGALALYEYVIAYEGDGYTTAEERLVISPLTDGVGEELSEVGLLLSHLTRKSGLDMQGELEATRQRDEAAMRLSRLREREERLESLRRRIQGGEISETYMAELEDHHARNHYPAGAGGSDPRADPRGGQTGESVRRSGRGEAGDPSPEWRGGCPDPTGGAFRGRAAGGGCPPRRGYGGSRSRTHGGAGGGAFPRGKACGGNADPSPRGGGGSAGDHRGERGRGAPSGGSVP